MAEGQPTFKELLSTLKRDVVWRLDWIGNITTRGSHNGQHEFSAFFSPLDQAYRGFITNPLAVDASHQTRVMLGAGYLPLLYTGALILNGQLLERPRTRIQRQRLAIGAMGTSCVSGNPRYLSLKDVLCKSQREQRQPSLADPDQFDVGYKAWPHASSSKLLALPDVGGLDPSYVLIPCMEVMRFFFCTTSVLATHLLQSGWQSLLWSAGSSTAEMPDSITVGSRTVRGLEKKDHRHLAYLLVCEHTRKAVEGLFQALQMTMLSRQAALDLQCPLPFDEPTVIEAEVVPMHADNGTGLRYLVTRLLSCQRPVPFARCYANPILNPLQGENRDSPDLKPIDLGSSGEATDDAERPKTVPVASDSHGSMAQGLTGDDLGNPTPSLAPIIYRTQEERFPELSKVPIELAPKQTQKYRSTPSPRLFKPIAVDQASTAIPEKGSRTSVISANARVDDPTRQPLALVDKFFMECATLLLTKGLKVHALSLPIPIIRARGHRAWASIQEQSPLGDLLQQRARSLNLLLISSHGTRVVVADIERKSASTGENYALVAYRPVAAVSMREFITDLLFHVSLVKRLPNEAHNKRKKSGHGPLWEARRKTTHKSNDTTQDFVRRLESKLLWPLLTKQE